MELDTSFVQAHNFLSYAYWLNGAYAQSVDERAKTFAINGDTTRAAAVQERFATGGWQGFLRFVISEHITPATRFNSLAHYFVALGEKDAAFAALNRAYENREPTIAILKVDPRLDPLRSDPRFQQLVQRVGFK